MFLWFPFKNDNLGLKKKFLKFFRIQPIHDSLVHSWLNPCVSLTRNMSEIEILNMELSKHSKLNGLKIMRISKESFKRISEVYRFLMDKINVEDSKEGFKINRSPYGFMIALRHGYPIEAIKHLQIEGLKIGWERYLPELYLKTNLRLKVNWFSIKVRTSSI